MARLSQLVKQGKRKIKVRKSRLVSLDNCPQKRGICVRVFTVKPKKPNSAIRKVARIRLRNGKQVIAAIPGIGHELQEHSIVIIRGGRANDLPGVRYKVVRGLLDFRMLEKIERKNRRSKYGVKKNK